MQRIKLEMIIFVVLHILSHLSANDYVVKIPDVNGTWQDVESYQWTTLNPGEFRCSKLLYSWGDATNIPNSTFNVDINANAVLPLIVPGLGEFAIKEVKKIAANEIAIHAYRYVIEDIPDSLWELVFVFHFFDEDTIWIANDYFEKAGMLYGSGALWHRISGPAKIPIQNATINDARVRLRVKPNLSSDTWAFLNTSDQVKIIDKSTAKQKIGDMEAYWYKVRTEKYPDGWVYGAYVDIIDD
jgi:hypothetical protein